MTEPELIDIDLDDEEREIMSIVLCEFGGPASYTPFPLKILGISTNDEFDELLDRLRRGIARKQPMSALDWARAQLLTETCWASNLIGCGLDYSSVADDRILPSLRSIQYKLCWYPLRSALFPDNGGRYTYADRNPPEQQS
jgi:hypothetical protein